MRDIVVHIGHRILCRGGAWQEKLEYSGTCLNRLTKSAHSMSYSLSSQLPICLHDMIRAIQDKAIGHRCVLRYIIADYEPRFAAAQGVAGLGFSLASPVTGTRYDEYLPKRSLCCALALREGTTTHDLTVWCRAYPEPGVNLPGVCSLMQVATLLCFTCFACLA
jgi:hypothetical protein